MAEPKTKPTKASVRAFLAGVDDDTRRSDAKKILALMRDVTGATPRMWGPSIVGFGSYHYVYASGREGDWPVTGFSPRARDLTLYITAGFSGYESLLASLGKHKTGKSCLYVKRLSDIDMDVLRELVTRSVEEMANKCPTTGLKKLSGRPGSSGHR
jgi:hypothetical protein